MAGGGEEPFRSKLTDPGGKQASTQLPCGALPFRGFPTQARENQCPFLAMATGLSSVSRPFGRKKNCLWRPPVVGLFWKTLFGSSAKVDLWFSDCFRGRLAAWTGFQPHQVFSPTRFSDSRPERLPRLDFPYLRPTKQEMSKVSRLVGSLGTGLQRWVSRGL